MPTNTYVALQTQTLGTSSASVTFSSIPATYTDLYIVIEAKNLAGNSDVLMRFNSDSGSNYSATILTGDGTSASSARRTNSTSVILNYFDFLNSTTATQFNVNIQNYSNATTYKTAILRANRANQATEAVVGLWRNTAAITQIDLTPSSSSFAAGSTFSLYGIAAIGDASPKATGGDVYSDANYWYHAFTMSGNFTPNQSVSCDVLVVAGGGGGGGFYYGGGGGAGGLRAATSQSLTATNYAVTIGGGGNGAAYNVNGTNGSLSTLTGILSASGGGYGAGYNTSFPTAGGAGGSGGGGGGAGSPGTASSGGAGNSGSYTPAEGLSGGSGYAAASHGAGGGGGGAGASGSNGAYDVGGAGGAGSDTYNSINFSTWLSACGLGVGGKVAGGGGGAILNGTNGTASNGGGAGGSVNGTVSTGGGGGGGSSTTAGNGGSGLVIVRYAK